MNDQPRHDQFDDRVHFGDQPGLPSSIEAEQALLGNLLLNPETFHGIADRVDAAAFFEDLHRDIFTAIERQVRAGRVPNPITIKADLSAETQAATIGGKTLGQYLAALCAQAMGSSASLAATVSFMATRRDLIASAQGLSTAGFGVTDEVVLSEEIEAAAARLQELHARLAGKQHVDGSEVAERYLQKLTERRETGEGGGVPMCLPELETVLSEKAFQPKRLYGLLSSSGEGKTSLTLQIIYRALQSSHPVLFLSYDQTHEECIGQMAAQQLGIELRRQQRRELSEREIEQCYQFAIDLGKLPFDVIDCTNENAEKLATYATTFLKRKSNGKTPLIVIDHIGTIRPDDARADEGTKARTIAQRLKALAKATGAAVLVLQQRSSTGMKRPNPRPIPSDLFGGEAAKQPFDAIAYLYRAEKYRKEQLSVAAGQKDVDAIEVRFPLDKVEGMAEIGALKVRFGDVSIRRKVEFEARLTRYKSLRHADEELPL